MPLSVSPHPAITAFRYRARGRSTRRVPFWVRCLSNQTAAAHFVVPAGKELFFQALDEQGLAVQSMRSGTHFQPGETRVCMGCHEPKQRAPRISPVELLATRRPPSRLQPDVDGTNPFSYARLVQPVLDQHCVDCHAKNADRLRLDAEPMQMTGQAYMDLNTTYARLTSASLPSSASMLTATPAVGLTARRLANSGHTRPSCMHCWPRAITTWICLPRTCIASRSGWIPVPCSTACTS